jgi:amino acid transporter
MARQSLLGLKELIAIGVGGMIGGGIFSVMGLAVGITGNATPIAFLLGGLLALIAGYSYVKLALALPEDGASFTYLAHAFPSHPLVAVVTGWTVIIGYVGTLALYAFTFGAYGAELLGSPGSEMVRHILSVGIIFVFTVINLYGVRRSGSVEDIVVYSKILLLGLLAAAGLTSVDQSELLPVVEHGLLSIFMAGALIFVAFEGFQLITNVVSGIDSAEKNIPRGIYLSILVVTLIYVTLSVVGVGSLSDQQLIAAQEYALAVAAEPSLGNAGRILVSLAALLATASAINATMLGASRMMAVMAQHKDAPAVFFHNSKADVPWVALLVIAILAILMTLLSGLELIAAFSSMTFLCVSLAVTVANFKLRHLTAANSVYIVLGGMLLLATITTLITYLWTHSYSSLRWIISIYAGVAILAVLFFRFRGK